MDKLRRGIPAGCGRQATPPPETSHLTRSQIGLVYVSAALDDGRRWRTKTETAVEKDEALACATRRVRQVCLARSRLRSPSGSAAASRPNRIWYASLPGRYRLPPRHVRLAGHIAQLVEPHARIQHVDDG